MSDRKLAGPFEPVEGVEWRTVHHGIFGRRDRVCAMAPFDDPCHLVTLYIEVQS